MEKGDDQEKNQLQELILQSVEHEKGRVKLYEMALTCAKSKDLHKEWQEYLEQTHKHVQMLQNVCRDLKIDPKKGSPRKEVVRHLGAWLLKAMKLAKESDNPVAAQLVACECVVLAETKDHALWQLLEKCTEALKGTETAVVLVVPEGCWRPRR